MKSVKKENAKGKNPLEGEKKRKKSGDRAFQPPLEGGKTKKELQEGRVKNNGAGLRQTRGKIGLPFRGG